MKTLLVSTSVLETAFAQAQEANRVCESWMVRTRVVGEDHLLFNLLRMENALNALSMESQRVKSTYRFARLPGGQVIRVSGIDFAHDPIAEERDLTAEEQEALEGLVIQEARNSQLEMIGAAFKEERPIAVWSLGIPQIELPGPVYLVP